MRIKRRDIKRSIIIFVYILILAFLGWVIYLRFGPAKATCTDKIKNQNEEDVDCGGVCGACKKIEAQDLIPRGVELVDSGTQGQVDVLGQIENPNSSFGSKKFEYQFDFKDASGNVFFSKKGESFILPGEKKYIVENNVPLPQKPEFLKLKILSSEWVEFNSFYETPPMKIINKQYNEKNSGPVFAEAVGILKNESLFDFNLIKIEIILRDADDKILALNSTEMRTVKSGEEREFKSFWPNKFPGTVAKMEVQSEVNVFDSQTFVDRYYKPQKFQQSF
jgi:hypothetical protein